MNAINGFQRDGCTSQRKLGRSARLVCRWFVHTALLTGCFRDYLVTVDRIRRPTVILLYHILLVLARVPSFPMALNWLAKLCDDLRCQHNPPRAVGACSHTLQPPCVAPISNRRNVHIQQFRRCQGGVAPIASLSAGTEPGRVWALEWNVVGGPNPLYLTRGEAASQACTPPFLIELVGNVCRRVRGSECPNPSHDLRISTACIGHQLRSGNGQVRERFRLPANTHLYHLLPFGQRHIFDEITEQLFALCLASRRCMPHRRDILGKCQNAFSLLRRDEQCCGLGQRCIFSLHLLHLRQFRIPVPL